MARVRSLLFPSFLALALVGASALPAAAAPADPASAVAFLDAQQVPGADPATGAGSWDEDTGFGLSEFTTTEAVLAIASAAQTGAAWNPTDARLAVEGTVNADGLNPLEFLDDWAEGGLSAGAAGKLLLLVALPLDDESPGFDPQAWDPAGDGDPVDLVATLGGCSDAAGYGFFGQTTIAMQAVAELCGEAGPAATQTVRDAQQANGGWSFDGDPSGATEAEIDTTAQAIMALVAGGVDGSDPAILDGLRFLAERQEPEGWWDAFGSASPDSTSRAMLAVTAAGWDLTDAGWRDLVVPAQAGSAYVSPDDALGALQQADGRIVGPDTFSAELATAQSVQALERNWLPVVTTTAPTPGEVDPPGPTPEEPADPPEADPPEADPPEVAPGLEAGAFEGGEFGDGVFVDDVFGDGAFGGEPSGSLPRTGASPVLVLAGVGLLGIGVVVRVAFAVGRRLTDA